MEGTPNGIDFHQIKDGLDALPSVVKAHDLHIWSLTVGVPSLSVHLVATDCHDALAEAQEYLEKMGISHSTIQTEHFNKTYPKGCEPGDGKDGCC